MRYYINKIRDTLSQFESIQRLFKGSGVIVMLHRIAPFEDKLSPNEAMKVSPEFLESFIIQALDLKYHFLSLDELYDGLLHNNLQIGRAHV